MLKEKILKNMKKQIETLVKGKFSNEIIALLEKNLEEHSEKPFSSQIILSFNFGEILEYKINKSTTKILKNLKPQNLEKIESPEIFSTIIKKLLEKSDSYAESYLEVIRIIKKDGEIFFDPKEHDSKDVQRTLSGLNAFLLSRGLFYSVKNTGIRRTFTLYKLKF